MELAELNKNRIGFITFRSHVSNPQVFEDFLSVFLPFISLNFPTYTYSIEKDDTPDRHIHMAVVVDEKIYDTQKLKQKIESKWYKDLMKRLSLSQTDIKHAWKLDYNKDPDPETDSSGNLKMTQIEHKMKVIGYIHKDINRRTEIRGLSQSLITKCCDFYFANRKNKNAVDKDWKQITSKNFHIIVEQYCKDKDYDLLDPMIHEYMVQDKHTFLQLSTKQRKMGFAELKMAHKSEELN